MADKVTVACKLPSGMRLDVMGPITVEDYGNGSGKVARADILKSFHVRGSAEQRRLESDGNIIGDTSLVVEGYGLTEVDADTWAEWQKQNAGSPLLTSQAIFAMPKLDLAKGKAREVSASVKTGFEPLNPAGDERMKGKRGQDITKADIPKA